MPSKKSIEEAKEFYVKNVKNLVSSTNYTWREPVRLMAAFCEKKLAEVTTENEKLPELIEKIEAIDPDECAVEVTQADDPAPNFLDVRELQALVAAYRESERQREIYKRAVDDFAEGDCCEIDYPQQFQDGRCQHCIAQRAQAEAQEK